jgi:polyisoprenoid-binding protein YceI
MTSIAAAGGAAQLPETAPAPPELQFYQLDPAETHSRFEVKFMGFITVRGKFTRTTGTLLRDPQLQHSSIQAFIDTTTLDAHVVNANTTNRILRGPEFFQVDKYPSIEFRSAQFVYEGERLLRIDGTLTLLGVTHPVMLAVANAHCTPGEVPRRARCEASASVTVKRSDYGMLGWSESVGDEVKIIVDLVAVEASREASPAKPELEAAAPKP